MSFDNFPRYTDEEIQLMRALDTGDDALIETQEHYFEEIALKGISNSLDNN